MREEFDCIICPRGCLLKVELSSDGETIETVEGFACERGEQYARTEIAHPMRTISSSVLVSGGDLPLVSVRLSHPVPKSRIPDVMREIAKLSVEAPCRIGDVLLNDILGLKSNLIVTKNINRLER